MDNKTKDLISRVDSITGRIDDIANETANARQDALYAIRDLLKGVKGHSIQTDNLEDFYTVTYEGRIGELCNSLLNRVYYEEENETDTCTGVYFELDDDVTLGDWEISADDVFAIFELVFNEEKDKKVAYINGKVAEHKPYAIRLNKEIEIPRTIQLTPVLSTIAFEKIDHIAFTDNEEHGAKAFTNFIDGVWVEDLSLMALTEIEIELSKGAYMAR